MERASTKTHRSVFPRHRAGTAKSCRRRRFRRGIALVWSALLLTVMMLMMGLGLDWGKTAWNVHQMHNAADAAALRGALSVKHEAPATTVALTANFASVNWAEQLPLKLRTALQSDPFGGDEAPFDIILGRWVRYNRTFIPTLDAPNAVKVIARRATGLGDDAPPLHLVFGQLAGITTVDASVPAIAQCNDSGGAGLICLNDDAEPGLLLTGTADLDVDGGGIHVNSTAFPSNPSGNDAAAQITGNALLDCGFINVVGGISPPPLDSDWESIFMGGDEGIDGFTVTDGTIDDVQRIDDPLAGQMEIDNPVPYVIGPWDRLDLPTLIDNGTIPTRTTTVEGTTIDAPIGSTCTLAPGYYPYGLRVTTTGETVTLDPTASGWNPALPPIYVFGGGRVADPDCGLYINGGNIIGEGVTCYVTQSYNLENKYGVTRLMGNGTIRLLSPGDQLRATTDPLADVDGLEGIAIWQDPTNPNYAHLNGGGDLLVSGTLYFPDPIHVRLEGNLGQAGNQILCGSAEVLGKALISVDYDGRNDPGKNTRIRLVQ